MRLKTILISSAFLIASFGAQAQTDTTPEKTTTTTETPAITTPDTSNTNAPVAGENSFTESQAKSQFEEAGYTNVMKLNLIDGIWHAEATKNSASVNVNLDYQGNITEVVK